MNNGIILFKTKLRRILKKRKITGTQVSEEIGIDRASFFYRDDRSHRKYIYMAIAYYLDMTVEELVEGTDAEIDWYGDADI